MNLEQDNLWKLIAALGADFHEDRVESIASAICELETVSNFDLDSLKYAFGPNSEKLAEKFKTAWEAAPEVSSKSIVAGLKTAVKSAQYAKSKQAIELVWTGPKTGLIPVRNTEQVAIQVIETAKQNLFLVSFVFYKADSIVEALNTAIARGIQVKVLLESAVGDKAKFEGLKSMHKAVPGATLYYWDIDKSKTNLSFTVHAKCVVADNSTSFITSANLTSAALERNMELGVLIRGGSIPERLQTQLLALAELKIIKEWDETVT